MRDEALKAAEAVAMCEPYRERSLDVDFESLKNLSEKRFQDCVHITRRAREELLPHVIEAGYSESDIEMIFEESWTAAWEKKAIWVYDGKLQFPLFIAHKDRDEFLEVSLKDNTREASGLPFFVSYIGFLRSFSDSVVNETRITKSELLSFAWIDMSEFLPELAKVALPEPWDFGHPNEYGHMHEILYNYITYTFFRLKQEDKIMFSNSRHLAAFNSGLVDSFYNDIYVCFEPNTYDFPEWRYVGLAARGRNDLQKKVNANFNPLPQRAEWFTSLDEIFFDTKKELRVAYEHIVLDNLHRFPVEWLYRELGDSYIKMLQLPSLDEEFFSESEVFDKLKTLLNEDDMALNMIVKELKAAIDMSCKRVGWNYKAAVPSYYPKGNSISFLLPLCLIKPDKSDVALVVELEESGVYQGETIITMEMAYTDARLICRPDSDWLDTVL